MLCFSQEWMFNCFVVNIVSNIQGIFVMPNSITVLLEYNIKRHFPQKYSNHAQGLCSNLMAKHRKPKIGCQKIATSLFIKRSLSDCEFLFKEFKIELAVILPPDIKGQIQNLLLVSVALWKKNALLSIDLTL